MPVDLPSLFCHSLLWQSVQWDVLEAFQTLMTQGELLVTKTQLCNQHCVPLPAHTYAAGWFCFACAAVFACKTTCAAQCMRVADAKCVCSDLTSGNIQQVTEQRLTFS